ncbi:hypothetical protein RhiirC2_789867 [Rhizophagus irregularis]|uniref:Uncharacterized protein n=1 Tax=Rhizophagus irregularis TaxID=588596 RepID=A0A2N1MMA8_9GLOM|nr:hypothetical protein RhiirC2_789867 [Rhizophagus irregularis]
MELLNEVFEQLNGLESIHIYLCYSVNNFIQQIIHITKPFKLKSLFINNNYNDNELLQLLFQKSGKYLENISLRPCMTNMSKQILLESIRKYCVKFKFFESMGSHNIDNFQLILDSIKNFKQSLNYLSIENLSYFNEYAICPPIFMQIFIFLGMHHVNFVVESYTIAI